MALEYLTSVFSYIVHTVMLHAAYTVLLHYDFSFAQMIEHN